MASWRYTRGSRSLAVTLGGVAAAGDTEPMNSPPDDDDQDIPQEVCANINIIGKILVNV